LQFSRINQVNLVNHHNRPDRRLGRGDQVAVDEPWLQARFGRAADDQRLVDIGHDDLAASAAGSTDDTRPWLYPHNHGGGFVGRADHYPVTGDHHMLQIGCQIAQKAADGAFVFSLGGLDHGLQAEHAHARADIDPDRRRAGSESRSIRHQPARRVRYGAA
jgi:hypothetical protein